MTEAKMWVDAMLPIFDRIMAWLTVAFLCYLALKSLQALMKYIGKSNAGIAGKAVLYAVPLFLAPCIEKLADILLNDQWPTLPRMAFCAMLGFSSMCIGLRAYFDGSYERDRAKPNPNNPDRGDGR